MMASQPSEIRFGLFFASIALLVGMFFFIYSMKYYFTLALVLSFSSQTQENGKNGPSTLRQAQGSGWLARIFGVSLRGPTSQEVRPPQGPPQANGIIPVGGLQPNLDHIKLSRYPFISIHLPFYNEKKVAERILSACTSFDYPNYEVIICDDSNDETVQIVKEWAKHPKVKILHRPTREGFKGGALSYALKAMDPRTEFVVVFDADFVPYPDTLIQFMKYFKATGGWEEQTHYQAAPIQTMPYETFAQAEISNQQQELLNHQLSTIRQKSPTAVVAGYQWHVLNKSENWITRGVRTEYAGSYVIERPGQEIINALKIIHGSVYCIRADVLKHFGWGTSITEDFELTLRIYEKGFKVIYTPYIQAPSECVSTIKRLIRQRMRWAEGHSFNVKKMFLRLLFGSFQRSNLQGGSTSTEKEGKVWVPSKLTFTEKLEFLYISPYYLQAFFFLLGTLSWLISETVFQARLPFWTSLWGWSLVLTNFFALPLMNAVGLFLEESEEKDYLGILSFIALSYLLVPFQAYSAVKGFVEPKEGPWFRTPKTGLITDVFTRGRFYRWVTRIIPGRRPAPAVAHSLKRSDLLGGRTSPGLNPYLSLATANNQFDKFLISRKRTKWIGRISLAVLLILSTLLLSLAPAAPYFIKPQETQAKAFGMLAGPQNDVNSKSQLTNQKTELIEKRTQNSKTYFLGYTEDDRARYALDSSIGDIHYKDNPDNPEEFWQEIDTEIQPVTDPNSGYDYQNITNNFKSFFKKESTAGNTVRYEYNGSFITLALEDNELGKINRVEGFAKDNQFIYPNAYDNIDVKYSIGARVLLEEFVLHQPKDIAKISQRVLFEDAYYQEQEDGSINFYSTKTTNELVWSFPKPKMYELNERKDENGLLSRFENYGLHYEITKEGNDYIITKVLDQEGKDWISSPDRVYPLVIDTTLDLQVGASADDTLRRMEPSNFFIDSISVQAGDFSSTTYDFSSGVRFLNITVPQGATVDVAYMSVQTGEMDGTIPTTYIEGEGADNAATFSTLADYDGRTRTTASVAWTPAAWEGGLWYNSAEIKTVIQEIVNRGGWVSGNALVLFWRDAAGWGGTQKRLLASSWDEWESSGPKLHIEYTPKIDTSTSSSATAYSFQRKTWYDGTRLWNAFYSGTEIEFWYSADWGSTWTQNTSATIAVSTNDFTIEADTADAFITYTNGYDIIANEDTGTYPATDFAWGASPTTVYDGSSGTDEFDYPAISKDSNSKVWITATHLSGTDYLFKAIQSTNANDISAWQTASTLDTSANSNKYGVIVSLGSGNMYSVWIDGTAIEGKKYGSNTVDKQVGASADDASTYDGATGWSLVAINVAWTYDSYTMQGGKRFLNVTILQGSTIDVAYETWTAADSQAGTGPATIYGDNEDNPATFSTYPNFNARPLTTASVSYTLPSNPTLNAAYNTPSLVTIIQEIVNRIGFASGNALALIHKQAPNNISSRYFTYNTSAVKAPKLHIEYTAWDASPTSIATGVTGLTNNMSAVSDSSGNVHLLYIDSNDYAVYQEYTTSWQTAVTLDSNAGNDYATISLNTSNNDLYAIWIRSNVIYYKKGVSPYASANWDASATSWKSTGTNTYTTSNYSGAGMIFAQWTQGTGSPYSVMWDYIIIPEKLWFLLGLGLVIPAILRRRKKNGAKKYL